MPKAFVLALIFFVLAACESGPKGSAPARDPGHSDRHGGICSPYASNCW